MIQEIGAFMATQGSSKRQVVPRSRGDLVRGWIMNRDLFELHPVLSELMVCLDSAPMSLEHYLPLGKAWLLEWLWTYPPVVIPVRIKQEPIPLYKCVSGIRAFQLAKAMLGDEDEIHVLHASPRPDLKRSLLAGKAELVQMQVACLASPAHRPVAMANLQRMCVIDPVMDERFGISNLLEAMTGSVAGRPK